MHIYIYLCIYIHLSFCRPSNNTFNSYNASRVFTQVIILRSKKYLKIYTLVRSIITWSVVIIGSARLYIYHNVPCSHEVNMCMCARARLYNITSSRRSPAFAREEAVQQLSYVAASPVFKTWEVCDLAAKLRLDLANLSTDPVAQLEDALNVAAFRRGLGNSLYIKENRIATCGADQVSDTEWWWGD